MIVFEQFNYFKSKYQNGLDGNGDNDDSTFLIVINGDEDDDDDDVNENYVKS